MVHEKLEKVNIPSLTVTYIITFINKLTKLKHELIIIIDANEDFTSSASDIARLCK